MSLLKTLTRILAVVGKELVEVVRRPGALISLDPRAVPDHGPLRRGLQRLPPAARHDHRHPGGLRPADRRRRHTRTSPARASTSSTVTADEAAAMQRLDGPAGRRRRRRPGRRRAAVRGRQAVADPGPGQRRRTRSTRTTRRSWPAASRREVNRQIIEQIAAEGPDGRDQPGRRRGRQDPAGGRRGADRRPWSTTSRPSQPTVVQYFGPAVLALILQHMAVTLIALSVVRERTSGLFELFRISPIRTGELVTGKLIAYGLFAAAIAAADDRAPRGRASTCRSSPTPAGSPRRRAPRRWRRSGSGCWSRRSRTRSRRRSSCRCCCCSRRSSSRASCSRSTSSASRSGR